MALPTILINSATGSDSAASGAGPATALTGTSASTDGAGTTVTLDGSPDLSGVATDGSHVIYLQDATAGARNFGKITGKDDGADTVTVANAFSLSASGLTWAIGGKRASLLGTNSSKLLENNSGNGDLLPGWTVEMESGHTETRASTINCRRDADATDGRITVKGTAGAATMPILTFSNNGNAIVPRGRAWSFENFEMQNTHGTKTASIAITPAAGQDNIYKNIRINDATNKFWKGISISSANYGRIEDCRIENCASHGIDFVAGTIGFRVHNNYVASCGGSGFIASSNTDMTGFEAIGNVFAFNTGDGLSTSGMTGVGFVCRPLIRGNVFHGNGGDGVDIPQTSAQFGIYYGLTIENNQFTFNGAYGIAMGGSGITDALLKYYNVIWRNNNFYSNTSGKYNPTTLTISTNETTTDPSSGSATAAKDYAGTTGGSNFESSVHKGLGYPIGGTLKVGGNTNSDNYQDIGLQHQDTGGAGGVIGTPSKRGGMQ